VITIIDYGMGNLRSVEKAVEKFCQGVKVSSSPEDVAKADKIILPGVGAFGTAMRELRKRRLLGAIRDSIEDGKPFLGICLGLQLLFSESEEGGRVKGLGIFEGKVKRFRGRPGLKIPHMGWNSVRLQGGRETGLQGLDGSYMYFVHSYYVEPKDKDIVFCKTNYGADFTSGIRKDNVWAFQFHPEKSQSAGLKIMESFVKAC